MADIDGMPPPTADEIVSAYESLFVRGSGAQLHGFARSGQLRHLAEHGLVPRRLVPTYLSTLATALNETARRGRLWCGERRDERCDERRGRQQHERR